MRTLLRVGACAACMWALAGCSPSVDFERMRQQPRADPYAANASFADGMAMRVPPPGAVAIEPHGEAEDAAHGQHPFEVFCAVCHGADGSGRSVMADNMPGTPPPSLLSAQAVALPDSDLFTIVTHGKNRMPPFDWALSAPGRHAIVAYVRALQQGAHGAAAGGRAR